MNINKLEKYNLIGARTEIIRVGSSLNRRTDGLHLGTQYDTEKHPVVRALPSRRSFLLFPASPPRSDRCWNIGRERGRTIRRVTENENTIKYVKLGTHDAFAPDQNVSCGAIHNNTDEETTTHVMLNVTRISSAVRPLIMEPTAEQPSSSSGPTSMKLAARMRSNKILWSFLRGSMYSAYHS